MSYGDNEDACLADAALLKIEITKKITPWSLPDSNSPTKQIAAFPNTEPLVFQIKFVAPSSHPFLKVQSDTVEVLESER